MVRNYATDINLNETQEFLPPRKNYISTHVRYQFNLPVTSEDASIFTLATISVSSYQNKLKVLAYNRHTASDLPRKSSAALRRESNTGKQISYLP